MAYTETTYDNWFSRIGGAIKGVIFGLILVIASPIVLFLNEGRAVHTAQTLAEGKSAVVSVDAAKIDSANEGKLVHFTGRAINATGHELVDPIFQVSQDAIHLRRVVSMYQWREDRKTETQKDLVGGGQKEVTTYTYFEGWKDQPLDSSNFKVAGHMNPVHWRFTGNIVDAATVTVRAFTLDSTLAGRMDNFTPVKISAAPPDGVAASLKPDLVYAGMDDAIFISNDPGSKADPNLPRIGDLKVTFEAVLPGDVSVVAMQSAATVAPFQTKTKALELLYVGNRSAAEMFTAEEQKNTTITWILRAAGFVAMWIGLAMILYPLKVLADVIGIIGDIMGTGIGIITGLVAVTFSCITIAIAWLTYRPLVGIGLLVVAAAAIIGFFVLRSKGAAQRKAVGPPQSANA